MNRDACKAKVIELLSINQDKPIAIAIDGKWGVGKTYFWKKELAPAIEEKFKKYPIYTSVFGKRNENEIIQDLTTQFLARENGLLEKCKNISEISLGILGQMGLKFDPTFIFQSLKKKDLENTIVCIDDFERLSDKIPPQDILGLISELKENKGCNVIVIFNEDELFKSLDSDSQDQQTESKENKSKTKERKIFERYKEKVFDFHIKFAPSTQEQFDLLCPGLLDTNFSAYEFLPKILDLRYFLKQDCFINLRKLDRANHAYQTLFSHFDLGEYPSEDFKKTYHYLLCSMIYDDYLEFSRTYFAEKTSSNNHFRSNCSPYASLCGALLEPILTALRKNLNYARKTSFFTYAGGVSSEIRKNFLKFVEKIVLDTAFHKDYMQELETKNNDPKEASINFFLKHQNNTKAIPYMFGFRILDYAFEEEQFNEKIKSFSLEIVMEKHQKECLGLFDQYCDEACLDYEEGKGMKSGEYVWINKTRFFSPLKELFTKFKINPFDEIKNEWFRRWYRE